MDYYSARIRLGGSVLNEVRKECLSAPEVIVMQYLHGMDSVMDLAQVDGPDGAFSHDAERERLFDEYDRPLRRMGVNFMQIFGPSHVLLPTSAPGYVAPDEEIEGEVSGGNKPRRGRSRIEKDLAAHEAAKVDAQPDAVALMD